jgi:outer membrane protein assembly factor BamB
MSDLDRRCVLAPAALALAMGLAALCTSGCESLRALATPERRRPGGVLSLELRRPVTAESRQLDELYERGRPAIDAAGRRLFVGSSDQGLYAIRADDGSTLWRFETAGAVQSEPLYESSEDVVYFGSNDGALYKVHADDGQLIWRFATNSEVARVPILRNGVLYVMNANDTLVALDAKSGKMRWTQHRTPALGMEIAGYAGLAAGTDKVYAAFSDGVVLAYALDDGSEQWPLIDLAADAEQATGTTPRYLDVDTTPVVGRIATGEVVYVGSYAGGVFALDAENGSRAWLNERATGVTELVLWEQPARPAPEGRGTGMPAHKILLASSGQTGLWALDPEDGAVLWRRDLPEGGISAPVPVAGALLVATTRYGLFLFSPLDGGLIDGIETGGIAMTPAAYGRRAFVMTNAGSLLRIHIEAPVAPGSSG